MRPTLAFSIALVLVLVLVGCSPAGPAQPPGAERPYPCILHAPSTLGPDFSVSQHIQATHGDRTGGFDGVLQKHGDEIVIVGLGPAGIRAFVLKQSGDAITFEKTMGPDLPFSPRNVMVDVHRVFWKRLDGPAMNGTTKGTVDDEAVEEDWKDGNLLERRFARPGSTYQGVVRVTYAPGCTRERCAPPSVRLVNEWFGYALTITNTDFNWL